MTAHAFAPGHVSGLFAVHDEAAALLHRGSRGAGWSVDLGATASVDAADTTRIAIDGVAVDAPVTHDALRRLAPGKAFDVRLQLGLPVGQGFGMSAAGTLAACMAAASVVGLDPEDALAATHAAEVASGTGLGDAVGSWFGSGEVRMRPGCPPHGWALRIDPPAGTKFLFCVVGAALATPTIIRDAAWKARTRELADPAVDRILAVGRLMGWDAVVRESAAFSKALGLMPDAMRSLGEALPAGLHWGQSMLGNTLWATGPAATLEAARPVLERAGRVIACGVDASGARVVRAPR
ncbi:MAG: hypothetical protein AABY18_07130 [Candidatus Thermoplasmatota archaeon]